MINFSMIAFRWINAWTAGRIIFVVIIVIDMSFNTCFCVTRTSIAINSELKSNDRSFSINTNVHSNRRSMQLSIDFWKKKSNLKKNNNFNNYSVMHVHLTNNNLISAKNKALAIDDMNESSLTAYYTVHKRNELCYLLRVHIYTDRIKCGCSQEKCSCAYLVPLMMALFIFWMVTLTMTLWFSTDSLWFLCVFIMPMVYGVCAIQIPPYYCQYIGYWA